eukprot:gnl/TRDRNA2_/TRDRNA2_35041_c0_seq1.p1 gnl/TRDRNA2_/TRDRNA2_35041_c0~~gnl/TRDRNA2_/TRDRNA2_35041_c0_seq1.p1  ORF type:complete len:364 (+),score=131.83 gnl/TRDRNA2_/TRDRNA2_35041_c0_seq1:30-1094(+)
MAMRPRAFIVLALVALTIGSALPACQQEGACDDEAALVQKTLLVKQDTPGDIVKASIAPVVAAHFHDSAEGIDSDAELQKVEDKLQKLQTEFRELHDRLEKQDQAEESKRLERIHKKRDKIEGNGQEEQLENFGLGIEEVFGPEFKNMATFGGSTPSILFPKHYKRKAKSPKEQKAIEEYEKAQKQKEADHQEAVKRGDAEALKEEELREKKRQKKERKTKQMTDALEMAKGVFEQINGPIAAAPRKGMTTMDMINARLERAQKKWFLSTDAQKPEAQKEVEEMQQLLKHTLELKEKIKKKKQRKADIIAAKSTSKTMQQAADFMTGGFSSTWAALAKTKEVSDAAEANKSQAK